MPVCPRGQIGSALSAKRVVSTDCQRRYFSRPFFFSILLIAVFRIAFLTLFAHWLCASLPASAGSFSIDPIRVTLSETKPSAVMRVENRGDASITVQLQAMRWWQAENHDQLEPSRELLATPQVFRLRPGQVQLVRVALLRPVDDQRELTYRLLLDEVPSPPATDFRGLQMALRISMPVFVQPRQAGHAALAARLIEQDGQRQLQLSNRGQAHLQLTDLSLESPLPALGASDGPGTAASSAVTRTLYAHDKTLYVLAGQQRVIMLPAGAILPAGASLSLRAQTAGGTQQWPVPAPGH